MIKQIIRVIDAFLDALTFPRYRIMKEKIRMIYYKKLGLGKKCECGNNLMGGSFCWNPTHDQDIRDKKLKEIGI